MRLESIDGVGTLEITLAGYESPDETSERSEANWLETDLHVRTGHGQGTSRVACMHTWDAADFVDWLNALATRQSISRRSMVFPEPDLQLEMITQTDQEVTLNVYFILEQPGEWDMDDALDEGRRYIGMMDLRLPRVALHTAVESLRAELLHFPIREAQT
ncbi:MAG: WapI family immunity protein [Ktedonobacterales bacterium]